MTDLQTHRLLDLTFIVNRSATFIAKNFLTNIEKNYTNDGCKSDK